jgi:hypothetical protein
VLSPVSRWDASSCSLLLDVTEAGTEMQAADVKPFAAQLASYTALTGPQDPVAIVAPSDALFWGGVDARRPLRSRQGRSRDRISIDSTLRSGQRIPRRFHDKEQNERRSRDFSGSPWSASVARTITNCPHFSPTAKPVRR